MQYIQTYEQYLNESFLSGIKDKFNNITDKEKLKSYLASLFHESEKFNKRFKRSFISAIVAMALSAMINTDEILQLISGDTKQIVIEELGKDNLLDSLAWRESSNKPYIVNKLGYIGKYQFHNLALVDAGVAKNKEEARKFRRKFIKLDREGRLKMWSEEDQDEAMKKLINKNRYYLRNFKNYIGKVINGIEITWSGLISAAHLGGQRNVKDFLISNGEKDFADANGTQISEYLSRFAGYKTNDIFYE